LGNLRDLYLHNNNLTGVIDESLGDFIAKYRFELYGNNFDCPYPTALLEYFARNEELCAEAASGLPIWVLYLLTKSP